MVDGGGCGDEDDLALDVASTNQLLGLTSLSQWERLLDFDGEPACVDQPAELFE